MICSEKAQSERVQDNKSTMNTMFLPYFCVYFPKTKKTEKRYV